MREKLDSKAKTTVPNGIYEYRSARVIVNSKAMIWDNMPFRDPSLSPSHDYAGQILPDGDSQGSRRVYFSSWEEAMEWLKGLDK
jgi:hypothetical protein